MKLLENLSNIIVEYSITDTLGDLAAAGIGATGVVGMPGMVALIAKNVNEVTRGGDILQSEIDKFKVSFREGTAELEALRSIKEGMDTISNDLADLSSRLIQLLPGGAGVVDMGAFAAEQILQLGLTEELPIALDKIHKIINPRSFVGKTDVVKAMDTVGEAHELLTIVGEAFEDFKDST